MPELPARSIFHALKEKLAERIDRRFTRQAIINVPVILVRFEPEFIRVTKEQQAEEQKDKDKSERGRGTQIFTRMGHDTCTARTPSWRTVPGSAGEEHEGTSLESFVSLRG